MSAGGITAEPPATGAPPAPKVKPGLWRFATGAAFLAPTIFLLFVWLLYPTVYTLIRSFFGTTGYIGTWVGIDNYKRVFTTSTLLTALKNNIIWVAVVPATVCAFGLVFAVLAEKIRWQVAFKTAIFLPMAISAFATGVTWRIMYQQDPSLGAINALSKTVKGVFSPAGVLPSAFPSTSTLQTTSGGAMLLHTPLRPGGVALLALTGIPPTSVPKGAVQAVTPPAKAGAIVGTVWRDFTPGGGRIGKVDKGELGLPGVTVELRSSTGSTVKSTKSADDGSFTFTNVAPGTYNAAVGAATFAKPFGGFSWLGPSLIVPSLLIAYIWIWAGFAMVVIGAGLAAMPRDVQEAARTDGATEWQVFRRVTVPLLAPVLSVVLITMVINVLKVFDLVISLAPESVWSNANVIALAMWQTAFGGVNDFGTASAIACLLFLLVVPILFLNVKRFKAEGS